MMLKFITTIALLAALASSSAAAQEMPLPPVPKEIVIPMTFPHVAPLAPWENALPARFPKPVRGSGLPRELRATMEEWRDDNIPPASYLPRPPERIPLWLQRRR